MSSSSSTESIWSGGIDSQGQKLDYAQGQKHATLRSQPATGSREAESKRGDSGDPQNPAPLSSEEERATTPESTILSQSQRPPSLTQRQMERATSQLEL